MKIYNKKNFVIGALCTALGLANLAGGILWRGWNINRAMAAGVLIPMGLVMMVRSLSQNMTQKDRVEALDERNRMIDCKARSMATQLTQWISFALMLGMMVMGKVSDYEEFIAIGVGLAFACTISMLTELFSYVYYERKN